MESRQGAGRLRRFGPDTRANVGLIFALSLLPAVGLVGLGIDYSSASLIKRKLDAAADAVVLNAVSRSSNPDLAAPSQDWARSNFNASLGRTPNVTVDDVTIASSYAGGSLQVSVSYRASSKTSFGSLFAVPSINLSGTAKSAAPMPSYADFHFLLDNSPSMGFAATAADATKLQSLTSGKCAFACHEHTATGGRITGDNLSDNYHLAKANNVKTRIDLLRTSMQQILDTAMSMEGSDPRYRAAVYTFSDVFQAVASLSADLGSTKNQSQNVDLAYAYLDSRNAQTDYETALKYLTPLVGSGGDGKTASTPRKYVLLITDGVQDQPVGSRSGKGDGRESYLADNTTTSPPASAQSNMANTHPGNVSAGGYVRAINPIDASQCDALKANNVQIAVLYTKYMPQPSDGMYNSNVAPIIDQVPTSLQKCASPNLFFTVDPTQDISAAMSSMFNAVSNGQPRLVN